MEGDDLLADHVLARREVARDGAVPDALGGEEVVDGPGLGGAVVAGLVDLGPDGGGAVVGEVRGDVGADGALVRARDDVVRAGVVVPLEGDLVTGGGRDEAGGCGGASDVADEIGAGRVLDGVVVGGRPDVLSAAVTLELAVDIGTVDTGVGRDGAHQGSGDSGSGVTHFDVSRRIF